MIERVGLLLFLFAAIGVAEAGPVTGTLQVESQSLVVEPSINRAEFKGAVLLKQDDFELRCDRLVAFYRQQGGGELERAEAFGHVTMRQAEKHGGADRAVFNQQQGTLTLIGNATMEDPRGMIRGEQIAHDIRTTETVVQQREAGGRARLSIDQKSIEGTNAPSTPAEESAP